MPRVIAFALMGVGIGGCGMDVLDGVSSGFGRTGENLANLPSTIAAAQAEGGGVVAFNISVTGKQSWLGTEPQYGGSATLRFRNQQGNTASLSRGDSQVEFINLPAGTYQFVNGSLNVQTSTQYSVKTIRGRITARSIRSNVGDPTGLAFTVRPGQVTSVGTIQLIPFPNKNSTTVAMKALSDGTRSSIERAIQPTGWPLVLGPLQYTPFDAEIDAASQEELARRIRALLDAAKAANLSAAQ